MKNIKIKYRLRKTKIKNLSTYFHTETKINIRIKYKSVMRELFFLMVPKIALTRYGKRTLKMGSTVYWNNIPDEHLKQRKDITILRRDWKLLNGHFCPSIAQCIFMYYLYVIFLDMIKALWVVIDDDKALLLLYIWICLFS